jgi:hypothetical protein
MGHLCVVTGSARYASHLDTVEDIDDWDVDRT